MAASYYDLGHRAHYTATHRPPCPHDNGWVVPVKFWIFTKRVFVCSDCGRALEPIPRSTKP